MLQYNTFDSCISCIMITILQAMPELWSIWKENKQSNHSLPVHTGAVAVASACLDYQAYRHWSVSIASA